MRRRDKFSKKRGIEKARELLGIKKQKKYSDYLRELSERENKKCSKQIEKFNRNKKHISKLNKY